VATLYTIGITQFLCAWGIRKNIERVVLIEVPVNSFREKTRSFKILKTIMSDCCEVLGTKFEVKSILCLEDKHFKSYEDIVDVAVYSRVQNKRAFIRPIFLAAQVEYVSVLRPSILSIATQAFKKRVILNLKIFIPNKIFEFYSMAPKRKRHLVFQERILDYIYIEFIKSQIIQGLANKRQYSFLRKLSKLNPNLVCFVLPRMPKNFEEKISSENLEIFQRVVSEIQNYPNAVIVVKNHPQDHRNYQNLIPNSGVKTIQLNSEIERQFPIEILAGTVQSFRCFGVESTADILLQYTCSVPPIHFVSKQLSKRYYKFKLGAISKLYQHKKVLI
jgi:hypothetical protein